MVPKEKPRLKGGHNAFLIASSTVGNSWIACVGVSDQRCKRKWCTRAAKTSPRKTTGTDASKQSQDNPDSSHILIRKKPVPGRHQNRNFPKANHIRNRNGSCGRPYEQHRHPCLSPGARHPTRFDDGTG